MKYILITAGLLFLAVPLSAKAYAQEGSPWQAPFPGANVPMTTEGEVDTSPTCFRVINRAPYTVMGSVYTNYYVNKDRQKARHTSNFRLEKGQSQPFCTYGPFYEGRKLELVLRTVLPIFSCKTMIDADIYLMGKMNEDGTTKTWATCLDKPQTSAIP